MIKEALTILLSFLLGYFIDRYWSHLQRKIPGKKNEYFKFVTKRRRFHHNFVGYVMIILGFFYYPLILVPVGMGIIMGHKIRDELFWFVEGVGKGNEKLGKRIRGDIRLISKRFIK